MRLQLLLCAFKRKPEKLVQSQLKTEVSGLSQLCVLLAAVSSQQLLNIHCYA